MLIGQAIYADLGNFFANDLSLSNFIFCQSDICPLARGQMSDWQNIKFDRLKSFAKKFPKSA